MNPPELYYVSPEQRQKYLVQPDMIPNGDRILDGTHEHVQVVKSSSLRFWYNVQSANFPSHWHTALEIIMPLDGNYVAHILSDTYVLEPGDIFIIPAGTIHSLEAPPVGSRLIYILEPNFLSQLPGFNYVQSLLSQPICIRYDDDPEYYVAEAKLILSLAEYYWSQSATKEMNLYACILSFFAKVGEKNIGTIPVNVGATIKNSSVVSQLSMALDYIDEHYSESITLEQAAQIAGFSKFYFTRLFKEYTNHTFYEHLTEKRIRAAEPSSPAFQACPPSTGRSSETKAVRPRNTGIFIPRAANSICTCVPTNDFDQISVSASKMPAMVPATVDRMAPVSA